jgi:O-antigen/teichoic acid export membrane protein
MGIIIRQSIKGTFWSYLGVVIGFITTAYLFPEYLQPETIGLFGLLLAWSGLFAQFSSLGFNGITSRLFPYFRDKEKSHNGFLFIALMVTLTGFLLFLAAFWFLKPWLIISNIEKSGLFTEYINLIIPVTFFLLLFNLLDIFNKLLYNAVFGTFLKELVQRILILGIVLLFIFKLISLHTLILAYAGAISAKGVVIFIYLLAKGEINFRPRIDFIDKKLKKEMINVALFSILAGIGGSIIFQIDKIIINQMLGLEATGIYTIAFFFGTLVVIPSRPLLRISGTLIANAWKRNDTKYIHEIYRKSCLNQFIIAAFLFGGIWINIENILIILGPEYAGGKWVIFFVGLGYLIDMATGANGQIISYSKHCRMGLWFLLILIVLVVSAMLIFIPVWGITGAAAAIALAFLMNNFMRFLFLYKKYNMQPFSRKFVGAGLAFVAAYICSYFIPEFQLLPAILIRSSVFTVVFATIILGTKVSEDINETVVKIRKRFTK